VAVAVLVSAQACGGAIETPRVEDLATRWWAHVEFLADDTLAGRETGSEGHRTAADYVARQFEAAGLEPAGTDGYRQPVGFVSRRILEDRSSLALVRRGTVEPVALGDEATLSMRIAAAETVDAPLVFAGYGLVVPELGHDDLAGIDVKGKIVVYLSGSPANVPGALGAHYQSAAERWAALRRAGAVGTVALQNPKSMDVPWERSAPNRLNPSMALADATTDDTAGQQIAVTFNPARAERLFEGSGHTFAGLLSLADARDTLPRFTLQGSLRATVAVETSTLESDNVVGLLRGSDPALRAEYVVLTAHLDHVGVGAPIDGDTIYNGAMDNASGIATLVEAAHTLARTPPKRSLLFVAVTGEEKGLLGSRYFATRPTVPPAALVANVNMDMFLPLFPMRRVMTLGLDESDLGDDIRAVAESMKLDVQADPEPARNRFIRSDQYSFIRQGIPALAMKVGYAPDSPEAAIAAAWTKERYHAPSDDLAQPIDRDAAAGFTRVIIGLCERIANRQTRPAWKADSFFRRFVRAPS
jgi:Zn-dependent M28 family amino/carboxypeptidase